MVVFIGLILTMEEGYLDMQLSHRYFISRKEVDPSYLEIYVQRFERVMTDNLLMISRGNSPVWLVIRYLAHLCSEMRWNIVLFDLLNLFLSHHLGITVI